LDQQWLVQQNADQDIRPPRRAAAGATTSAGLGKVTELEAELDRLRHKHALRLAEERTARAVAETETATCKSACGSEPRHIADLHKAGCHPRPTDCDNPSKRSVTE
jgi:hypothetical protein